MDREDVVKAIEGDEDSFRKIVEEKQKSIYRIAYSYTHNAEDALDIVQETVYKAFVSITKLKNPEYFSTWFYRIAVNSAIDFIKKNQRVTTVSDEVLENVAVYNETDRHEDGADLQQALDSLNAKYKAVIILRFFEELSLEEIADVLNVPLSTVKTRLYRGLDKLKIELKEVGVFGK